EEGERDHSEVKELPPVPEEDGETRDEESEEISFPDTTISLSHLQPRSLPILQQRAEAWVQEGSDSSGESQGKKHMTAKQRREEKKKQKQEDTEEKTEIATGGSTNQGSKGGGEASQQPLKRGQKNKLKKIKEKYKDQDEEDRELMMQLLASAGPTKEEKEKAKKGKKGKGKEEPSRKAPPQKPAPKPRQTEAAGKNPEETGGKEETEQKEEEGGAAEQEKEDDMDQDNPGAEDTEDLLTSLTGQPHPEDVLLFAVPVCAPYTALSSYKHKVKVTPGSQKKGKAARVAVLSFMKAKDTTARERDLYRSVKVDSPRTMWLNWPAEVTNARFLSSPFRMLICPETCLEKSNCRPRTCRPPRRNEPFFFKDAVRRFICFKINTNLNAQRYEPCLFEH
ncbi:unnamed protein product, partial [Tetraodon nigroviridis]